jgi:hypothetical protein
MDGKKYTQWNISQHLAIQLRAYYVAYMLMLAGCDAKIKAARVFLFLTHKTSSNVCNFSIFHLLNFSRRLFDNNGDKRECDDDEKEFRKSLNSKNHTINVYRQVTLTGGSSRCYYIQQHEIIFLYD